MTKDHSLKTCNATAELDKLFAENTAQLEKWVAEQPTSDDLLAELEALFKDAPTIDELLELFKDAPTVDELLADITEKIK